MFINSINKNIPPIAYYGVEVCRPGTETVIVFHSPLWREDVRAVKHYTQAVKALLAQTATTYDGSAAVPSDIPDEMLVYVTLQRFINAAIEGDARMIHFHAAVLHKLVGKPNGFTIAGHLAENDMLLTPFEVTPRPFETYNEAKAAIATLTQAVREAHEASVCDDAEAA